MALLPSQQVERSTLIDRLSVGRLTIVHAQQATAHVLADALEREHAAAKAQQYHDNT